MACEYMRHLFACPCVCDVSGCASGSSSSSVASAAAVQAAAGDMSVDGPPASGAADGDVVLVETPGSSRGSSEIEAIHAGALVETPSSVSVLPQAPLPQLNADQAREFDALKPLIDGYAAQNLARLYLSDAPPHVEPMYRLISGGPGTGECV